MVSMVKATGARTNRSNVPPSQEGSAMPEFFVIVSEHDAHREFIPFAAHAPAWYTPGRFQSSVTYGPYTERGAERVARRALSQVSDAPEWQTYGETGKRYARDEHGIRMVDVFSRPAGTYRRSERNMPKGA